MPIYEYACGKCDHEWEVEQRITDDPLKTCPACRSRKVKKLISQTSFVLKGSGWYSDLYSSKKSDKTEGKGDAEGKGAKEASSSDSSSKDKKGDKSEKKSAKKGGKGSPKAAA
jgi:putative FmdB family regulatory protein